MEHIVSNHSGNKASSLWVNGHMDSFPSLVSDHLSLGLLSFYTRLYWLTVTRGACQYKITPEEKRSWISFLIGFTLLHGMVWWLMARAGLRCTKVQLYGEVSISVCIMLAIHRNCDETTTLI